MQDRFLTAAAVAQLFKLNVEVVHALIAEGRLPATEIGGQWRFEEPELRTWLKERRSLFPAKSRCGGRDG